MTYDRIKYFYEAGLWNAPMVKVAVRKGIITKAQYTELTGLEYGSVSDTSIRRKGSSL